MSMIGKSLAHYQISSQIGKGGMGEVIDVNYISQGSVIVAHHRFGDHLYHSVLISAPTFAALNEYLDAHSENSAFAEFQAKVSEISDSGSTSILQVVKIWK
jgi:hypothetical protein